MKNRYNYKFSHIALAMFLIVMSLGVYQPASAQKQILGDPSTCPYCNPPASVLQLRKFGNALKEFPRVHLFEGEMDSVMHSLTSAKYSHVQKFKVPIKKQKGNETIEQVEVYKPLGIEPYYYKDAEVTILASSVPKALLTVDAYLSDTKDTLDRPQEFSMFFRAGTPGKDAVVWLQGSATRQSSIDSSDSSKVYFLVPILIHKHHLPLYTQELSVNRGTKLYFKINEQKPGESVRYSSGINCSIKFDEGIYDPVNKPKPHLLSWANRNCAVVAHIFVKGKDKNGTEIEIKTKRVLIIVKDNMSQWSVLTDRLYYENVSNNNPTKKFFPAH